MVYETLINLNAVQTGVTTIANKPNYTPANSFKKALKMLRKLFKKSSPKHQQFLDESMLETSFVAAEGDQSANESAYASDEECDNYANERLEGSN